MTCLRYSVGCARSNTAFKNRIEVGSRTYRPTLPLNQGDEVLKNRSKDCNRSSIDRSWYSRARSIALAAALVPAVLTGCGTEQTNSAVAGDESTNAEGEAAATSAKDAPAVSAAAGGTNVCTPQELAKLEEIQNEDAKLEPLTSEEIDQLVEKQDALGITATFLCDGTQLYVDTSPDNDGHYTLWMTMDRDESVGWWPSPYPPGQAVNK